MKFLAVFIGVMIFIAVLSGMINAIAGKSGTEIYSETVYVKVQPNTEIALDRSRISQILNVTNTTTSKLVGANNYTLRSDQLVVLDNGSNDHYNSDYWVVTYEDSDGKLSGASLLLIGLVVLIVMAGFIMGLVKSNKGR